MNENEVIAKMRELGIESARFNFSCGGDSMGDTYMEYEDSKGESITEGVEDLNNYFDDEVYRHVTFYECSDGHYCGEAGFVYIEVIKEEGEEERLEYSKNAQSEWSESIGEEVLVEVSPEEQAFIEEYVANFGGGEGEATHVNFSKDFLMTDEQEKMLEDIKKRIDEQVIEHEVDYTGEPQDWYNFSAEDLEFRDGCLVVNATFYEYVYRDSEY